MATVAVKTVAYDLKNCNVELVGSNGTIGLVGTIEELDYSPEAPAHAPKPELPAEGK